VRSPSKSCRFSHPLHRAPERGAESFAACGQRRGLLALDLGSIFKKLLHQKTFVLLRSATVKKMIFMVQSYQAFFVWCCLEMNGGKK
jgi:hypothetical protein